MSRPWLEKKCLGAGANLPIVSVYITMICFVLSCMAIAMVKILGGGGGGGDGNITFGSGRGGGGGGGGGGNRSPLTMAVVVCMTDDGG